MGLAFTLFVGAMTIALISLAIYLLISFPVIFYVWLGLFLSLLVGTLVLDGEW